MRVQGQKLELDQRHQTNLGYGLVCIKGQCYHHSYLLLWLMV